MAVVTEAHLIRARVTDAIFQPPRLIFANQLRGLAAFSVIMSHLIGVYWAGRVVVASATATPVLEGPSSRLLNIVAFSWFNFGPFGVAVFFLISGLVIPISLGQHTKLTFIVSRFLRVYPTFMAAFIVSLIVVFLNSEYWTQPFPVGMHSLLTNLFLVQNFFADPDVTLVSWTLAIEIKFYIIMTFFRSAVLEGSTSILFLIGFAVLSGNLAMASPICARWIAIVPHFGEVLLVESSGLVFMLIGVLFNYRLRGLLSARSLLFASAGMTGLFIVIWCTSAFSNQFPRITANYLYAVAVFAVLYAFRNRIPRITALDALAAISFPLYLVHSLVGYSALKFFMLRGGLSYRTSLPLTLLVVFTVATGLHISIERWTIRLGKKLSRAKQFAS